MGPLCCLSSRTEDDEEVPTPPRSPRPARSKVPGPLNSHPVVYAAAPTAAIPQAARVTATTTPTESAPRQGPASAKTTTAKAPARAPSTARFRKAGSFLDAALMQNTDRVSVKDTAEAAGQAASPVQTAAVKTTCSTQMATSTPTNVTEQASLGDLVDDCDSEGEQTNAEAPNKGAAALQMVKTRIRRHVSQDSVGKRRSKSIVGNSDEEIARRAELKRQRNERIKSEIRNDVTKESHQSSASSSRKRTVASPIDSLLSGGPRDHLEFLLPEQQTDSDQTAESSGHQNSAAAVTRDSRMSDIPAAVTADPKGKGKAITVERTWPASKQASPTLRQESDTRECSVASLQLPYSAEQLVDYLDDNDNHDTVVREPPRTPQAANQGPTRSVLINQWTPERLAHWKLYEAKLNAAFARHSIPPSPRGLPRSYSDYMRDPNVRCPFDESLRLQGLGTNSPSPKSPEVEELEGFKICELCGHFAREKRYSRRAERWNNDTQEWSVLDQQEQGPVVAESSSRYASTHDSRTASLEQSVPNLRAQHGSMTVHISGHTEIGNPPASRAQDDQSSHSLPSETSSYARREVEQRSVEQRFAKSHLRNKPVIAKTSSFREEFNSPVSPKQLKGSLLSRLTNLKKVKSALKTLDGTVAADGQPASLPQSQEVVITGSASQGPIDVFGPTVSEQASSSQAKNAKPSSRVSMALKKLLPNEYPDDDSKEVAMDHDRAVDCGTTVGRDIKGKGVDDGIVYGKTIDRDIKGKGVDYGTDHAKTSGGSSLQTAGPAQESDSGSDKMHAAWRMALRERQFMHGHQVLPQAVREAYESRAVYHQTLTAQASMRNLGRPPRAQGSTLTMEYYTTATRGPSTETFHSYPSYSGNGEATVQVGPVTTNTTGPATLTASATGGLSQAAGSSQNMYNTSRGRLQLRRPPLEPVNVVAPKVDAALAEMRRAEWEKARLRHAEMFRPQGPPKTPERS